MKKKYDHRVLFITTSMPAGERDWKSVFIGDMYRALENSITDLLFWGPSSTLVDKAVNQTIKNSQQTLDKIVSKGGIASLLRQKNFLVSSFYALTILLGIRKTAIAQSAHFDCYFINWLQNAIALPADNKPLVLTALGSDIKLLDSPVIRLLLRRVFKKHPTVILYNASWMRDKLDTYFGKCARLEYGPLGIRKEWFESQEQKFESWISVSRVTESKVSKLLDWGKSYFTQSNRLILIGPNQDNMQLPDWVDFKGSTNLESLRKQWYPMAKGLIFLSEHDEGRPQTIIEAMASGVPVICLDKALYREFIESGVNGYLISSKQDLLKAIKHIDDNNHRAMLSTNAKQSMKSVIGTWDDYAIKVCHLFNSLRV